MISLIATGHHGRVHEKDSRYSLLYTVGENHNQPRVEDKVRVHVLVLALHDDDGLLPGDTTANVVVVLTTVQLPGFQRGQARRPATLVRVLHQFVYHVERGSGLAERTTDDCLEDGVRRGYHAAPAGDPGRLERVRPPNDLVLLHLLGEGAYRGVRQTHRAHEFFQQLELALLFVQDELVLFDFGLEVGDARLLLANQHPEFFDAVVVLELVLGHNKSAAKLARNGALRVEFAFLSV